MTVVVFYFFFEKVVVFYWVGFICLFDYLCAGWIACRGIRRRCTHVCSTVQYRNTSFWSVGGAKIERNSARDVQREGEGRQRERWDGREGKISLIACSRSAISWQLALVLFSFEFVGVSPTVSTSIYRGCTHALVRWIFGCLMNLPMNSCTYNFPLSILTRWRISFS